MGYNLLLVILSVLFVKRYDVIAIIVINEDSGMGGI